VAAWRTSREFATTSFAARSTRSVSRIDGRAARSTEPKDRS